MPLFLFALAASGLLTDFGWQKSADGELEYVLQIEPELLASLKNGEEIISEVPAELSGVRRIRVRVGTGPLPQGDVVGEAAPASAPRSTPPLGLPEPPREFPPTDPQPPADRFDPNEPPPLLPRGGAFQPTIPHGHDAAAPMPGAEGAANKPDSTTEPSGAFPIDGGSSPDLRPIPRDDAQAPSRNELTERLTDQVDNQVRPATASQPIAEAASEHQSQQKKSKQAMKSAAPRSRTTAKPALPATEAGRPWMPLLFTSLLLFASLGLNVYLGWITRGAIQRYRSLAKQCSGSAA